MSTTVSTPIVDKNGKATTVHKKVETATVPKSRIAGVAKPPTANAVLDGQNGLDALNAKLFASSTKGKRPGYISRDKASEIIYALKDKVSPTVYETAQRSMAEVWADNAGWDKLPTHRLTDFMAEEYVYQSGEQVRPKLEAPTLISFADAFTEQLQIFTENAERSTEFLDKDEMNQWLRDVPGGFTADALSAAQQEINKMFSDQPYGTKIPVAYLAVELRNL